MTIVQSESGDARYEIVYSDGVAGAALDWSQTLDLLRRRLDSQDSYRRRGIVARRVRHPRLRSNAPASAPLGEDPQDPTA